MWILHSIGGGAARFADTDVVDLNVLPAVVEPWEDIYGETSSNDWGWSRTDHCQFVEPADIVTPIYDATDNVSQCMADMLDPHIGRMNRKMGINIVPPVNPDVVPLEVTREVEGVNPLCLLPCASVPGAEPDDPARQTAGWCRKATGSGDLALCTAPDLVHVVTWANPAISGIQYGPETAPGVKTGDYISFEWDDVIHDVWLVPEGAADPCDITGWPAENQLIAPSHHATFDPFDNFVEGRNLYKIPENTSGAQLTFICNVNGHCGTGMVLPISVDTDSGLAYGDPALHEGICPDVEDGDDYDLCPDQSLQGETTANVATEVNVPWSDPIGAEGMRLTGTVTRASTPWDNWQKRTVHGRKCRLRDQNTRTSNWMGVTNSLGADHSNRPVWQFPHHTLRDVVEACSSSHPEPCTGISWRGGINSSELSPRTGWTWSRAARGYPWLGHAVGWVAGGGSTGEWIQIDLGDDMPLTGVVTQSRGNNCCGPQYVASYRVQYSSDDVTFTEIAVIFNGPTADDYAASRNTKVNAYFPEPITARYVRFVVETHVGAVAMRAGVLLHVGGDMVAGKHEFRRCLESDGYTRVVTVGQLTDAETEGYTLPVNYTKTVECPGCFSCREEHIVPQKRSPATKTYWGVWGTHHQAVGFNVIVNDPGTVDATLSVHVQIPTGGKLTWNGFEAEFICRVDPATSDPINPEDGLIEDSEWTSFLLPSSSAVIDDIVAGFQPAEAAYMHSSVDQTNLGAVYPPGEQLDASFFLEPGADYYSRNWRNLSNAFDRFVLPPQQINGERGGAWWPPKPQVKVTFMPDVPACNNMGHPKCYLHSPSVIAAKMNGSMTLGWHIDSGHAYAAHVNVITGETAEYGWRCNPFMWWYGHGWRSIVDMDIPVYDFGTVKQPSKYHDGAASHQTCPDGRRNAWEIAVPNGVYTVTVGTAMHGGGTCYFENHVAPALGGATRSTSVFSVEVSDGRFTLTSSRSGGCAHLGWIKLDLVSETLFPAAWLPAPPKEWLQLELDEPSAEVGLVQIRLPHVGFQTAASYPYTYDSTDSDCRKGWLHMPAKCYRYVQTGLKYGSHPDLASYPNFPGFTPQFLGWLFDKHDTNANGNLDYDELHDAQFEEVFTGPYAMWERDSQDTGTQGYRHARGFRTSNIAHLWQRTNVVPDDGGDGLGEITKAEFVTGMLSRPRDSFCDLFESTAFTHGGNVNLGSCMRNRHGVAHDNGQVPSIRGPFADDGNHGFRVTISDVRCTDESGCPSVDDSDTNTSLCAYKLEPSGDVESVDCQGASGKYLQIALPGDGNRLLPTAKVTVHRASMDGATSVVPNATDDTMPMVCYGLASRPVPEPDDPDLLAGTKLHPKQIVKDNPEDPIFWSTCLERVIIKTWRPLEDGGSSGSGVRTGFPYSFLNETRCLSCDAVRENNVEVQTNFLRTPHWYLQPEDTCTDCNYELFGITGAPTVSSPTASPMTHIPTSAAVTHIIPWARTTGSGGSLDQSSFSILVAAFDVVRWELVDGGHNVVSLDTGDRFTSSGWMANDGDVYSITFDTPGVYHYHCSPHPDMVGTITVLTQGLTESPTTSSPTYEPTPSPTHAPLSACIFENSTETSPRTGWTWSRAARGYPWLGHAVGWVAGGGSTGEWIQIDLGDDMPLTGVVTQSRGNNCCGPQYVASYRVQYSSDDVTFTEIAVIFNGPTADDYAASRNTKVNAYFPEPITARYVRFVVETHVGAVAMRAGVLLPKADFAPCIKSTVDQNRWTAGFSPDEATAVTTVIQDMLRMKDVSECVNRLPQVLTPRFSRVAQYVDGDPCCFLAEDVGNTGAGFVIVRITAANGLRVLPVHLHAAHPGGNGPMPLAQQGHAYCPAGSTSVSATDCLRTCQELLPAGVTQGRTRLISGNWGRLPLGCSMQTRGDYACHYSGTSRHFTGHGYSLVCRGAAFEPFEDFDEIDDFPELNIEGQALSVFASAKIKALVVAGAHRFSGLDSITSPSCPHELAADAAHNVDAIPFAAARATAAHYATLANSTSWAVLDLDGMASTACDADVYLTPGADAEGGSRLASFLANLEAASPAAVFAQPEAGVSPCAEHGGTNTTTGRLLNGVPEADVCATGYGAGHAVPTSGHYIYVAQSVGLLASVSASITAGLATAIAQTW